MVLAGTTLVPNVRESWLKVITPLAATNLADFQTWPLYQNVGQPWSDVTDRFVRIKSLALAHKTLKSNAQYELLRRVNPGINYPNLSGLLNMRMQYFVNQWDKLCTDRLQQQVEPALQRIIDDPVLNPTKVPWDMFRYGVLVNLREFAWEKLHPLSLEAPFHEQIITIFRAGHLAAGVEGSDWKTCRFWYF